MSSDGVAGCRVTSAGAMEQLGAAAAATLASRTDACCIWLEGDLAAGKTTFTRGFVRARGHAGAVKSPTFTLVESYRIDGRDIHHFDLYRLGAPEELEYIGIDEYFGPATSVLVEWPARGAGVLPAADLVVAITVAGRERDVTLTGTETLTNEIVSRYENSIKTA